MFIGNYLHHPTDAGLPCTRMVEKEKTSMHVQYWIWSVKCRWQVVVVDHLFTWRSVCEGQNKHWFQTLMKPRRCVTRYHPVSSSVCFVEHFWRMTVLSLWSKSVVTRHWKKRLIPCPVTLNEKSGSEEIKERECSSHCHHPAPLSGLTLTLKWVWPHHTFGQIIINDMILTLPDSFFFFFFLGHFSILLEFVVLCPCYLALQTLLSLWGRGAERWQ